MRYRILTILLLAFMTVPVASGEDAHREDEEGRYDDLIRTYIGKHPDSILKSADESFAGRNLDESRLLYLIATKKDLTGASDKEVNSVAQAHLKAGNLFADEGNYPQALSMYVKGLKLSETIPDNPLSALFYENMGNIYHVFEDHEKAIHLYRRALENRKAGKKTVYGVRMNLIMTYLAMKDTQNARKVYDQAVKMKYKGSAVDTFLAGFAHAMLIDMEGRRSEGMKEYVGMADFARRSGIDPRFECSVYQQMANSLLENGDLDAAGACLDRTIELATKSGRLHLFVDGLKQRAMIYGKRGNREMELRMKERYFDLKDSIFNADRFSREKDELYLYEVDKYTSRIEEISREKLIREMEVRTQRRVLAVVCAGALIILLFLGYVVVQKKKLNRSYTTLYRLHEQMHEAHRRETARMVPASSTGEGEAVEGEAPAPGSAAEVRESPQPTKYTSSNLDAATSALLFGKIKDFMDRTEDYFDPEFSLRRLAATVGSNDKYVSQVINEHSGQNFNGFVNAYRIAAACARLSDIDGFSRYTIKGIGENVGFKAHSSFVRAFKQIVGMTPSDYQKVALREHKASVHTE